MSKPEGDRKQLDLTIKDRDGGNGLLRFFSPISHEECYTQLAEEFERMAERQEESRLSARRVAIRKAERAHGSAKERQHRH
jgi:hypothetical protein